jgi:hypothetical protein
VRVLDHIQGFVGQIRHQAFQRGRRGSYV